VIAESVQHAEYTIMPTRCLLALVSVGVFFLSPVTARAGMPPLPPTNMPGQVQGQWTTWWLVPYVTASTQLVGPGHMTTVRWLSHDGKTDRELAGPDLGVQPGFLIEY
jgi:hypothetical protein